MSVIPGEPVPAPAPGAAARDPESSVSPSPRWSLPRNCYAPRRIGKRIDGASPKALEKLTRYDWPGNVRELANIIERAVILCDGRVLQSDHIIRSPDDFWPLF